MLRCSAGVGRSLRDAAREYEQHDEQGRLRGAHAPPTAGHGSRIERRRDHPCHSERVSHPHAGTLPFGPQPARAGPHWPGPRSSGDRAPPSGGGSASSNLAGGASISPSQRLLSAVPQLDHLAGFPFGTHGGTHQRAPWPARRPLHRRQRRADRRTGARTGRASSSPTCGRASAARP